jgi:CspA family cold shock protein
VVTIGFRWGLDEADGSDPATTEHAIVGEERMIRSPITVGHVAGRIGHSGLLPGPKVRDIMQGTVKWFNDERGFGFIQLDGDGRDIFVHIRAAERAGAQILNEGQRRSRST